MPNFKTIMQVATVTMAVMFVANQAAARNAQARKVVRGTTLSVAV